MINSVWWEDAVASAPQTIKSKLPDMSYAHLTQEERYQISALKQANHNQGEIAKLMNRSKSTMSRELKRNCGQRG